MILADKGIIPPKEWLHDPILKNDFEDTVAMILSCEGVIPPKEWYHDPIL